MLKRRNRERMRVREVRGNNWQSPQQSAGRRPHARWPKHSWRRKLDGDVGSGDVVAVYDNVVVVVDGWPASSKRRSRVVLLGAARLVIIPLLLHTLGRRSHRTRKTVIEIAINEPAAPREIPTKSLLF
ncbi:hypothetical protein V3C99_017254 [Haemonchus contortus]